MENFDNKFRKKIERGEGASFEHPNVEGISDELLQHLSYSLGRMWCSEADKEKVESMIADSSKIEKSIKLILSEKMAETEQALSDPKHYSDPDSPTLQGLLRERVSLQGQIDDFEEEWLRLELEREALS